MLRSGARRSCETEYEKASSSLLGRCELSGALLYSPLKIGPGGVQGRVAFLDLCEHFVESLNQESQFTSRARPMWRVLKSRCPATQFVRRLPVRRLGQKWTVEMVPKLQMRAQRRG